MPNSKESPGHCSSARRPVPNSPGRYQATLARHSNLARWRDNDCVAFAEDVFTATLSPPARFRFFRLPWWIENAADEAQAQRLIRWEHGRDATLFWGAGWLLNSCVRNGSLIRVRAPFEIGDVVLLPTTAVGVAVGALLPGRQIFYRAPRGLQAWDGDPPRQGWRVKA